MKNKWHYENVRFNDPAEAKPLRIIHDGGIASQGLGEGRLFPLIIIDTSARPDVQDMITAHKNVGPGDATTGWAKLSKTKQFLSLFLSITRPSQCNVIIEFDLYNQAILVDAIVQAQGLYLQSGKDGDRLATTLKVDKVLIEVDSLGFKHEWEKIYVETAKHVLHKSGLSRKDAKAKAEEHIAMCRSLIEIRLLND